MTHRLNGSGPGDGGHPAGGDGARPDDLTDQVFRLLDGKLDADAEAELYRRLECDAEARRVYRRCVNLDVALRLFQAPAADADGPVAHGTAEPVAAAATGAPGPPGRPPWLARTAALASSVAAVVLLGLWLGWESRGGGGGGGGRSGTGEPARGATLAAAIDAQWDGVGATPGTAVPPGAMSLRAGVVKLSFASGAQVVVAGPARFTVESAGQMSLDQGRLSAVVPAAAAGFTVRTPTARLVDLGTEFDVAVGTDDGTRMSVIAGAVAVSPGGGGGGGAAATAPAHATPPVRVTAGTGARVAPRSLRVEPTSATPIGVPRVAQVDAWSAAGGAGDAYRRWAGGATAAAADRSADLLLRFDFDDVRGEQISGASPRGPVVGRVPGRHVRPAPGPFAAAGGALRLDGAGGYAHLGTHPPVSPGSALTLAAWIRPDAIDGIRYVLSTGFDPRHEWEVYLRLVDGTYEVGMGVETDVRDHKVNRPIPPDDVGRWVHIAAVYDGMGWRIYRNGQTDMRGGGDPNMVSQHLAGSRDWYAGARARQTAAGVPRSDRYFKGDIDDVRVYAAALSPAEVAELARRHP